MINYLFLKRRLAFVSLIALASMMGEVDSNAMKKGDDTDDEIPLLKPGQKPAKAEDNKADKPAQVQKEKQAPRLEEEKPAKKAKIVRQQMEPADNEEPLDAEQQFQLAQMYRAEGDQEAAHQYYEKAAAAGHKLALRELGSLKYNENGTLDQHKEALQYFEESAKKGDLISKEHAYKIQIDCADALIKKDQIPQAIQWLEKAETTSHSPKLQVQIAGLYKSMKNLKNATVWYAKAVVFLGSDDAEDTNAAIEATRTLGEIFLNGEGGLEPDAEQAIEYFGQAAAFGDTVSQQHLDKLTGNK